MHTQDWINQHVWSQPGPLGWLAQLQGYTDRGEFAAYWRIVDEVRGRPILDLGVGCGRTISLLRPLTDRYVAIDYLPAAVEVARRRFPFVDVQEGDARDLSRFPDASFFLVVFSYAGIDAVDHAGRARILAEVSRVLMPGGIFWFSTLNKDGPRPRERPWAPHLSWRGRNPVNTSIEALRALKGVPRGIANYARLSKLQQAGEGWSVAPFSAHEYGLLVHYTTLAHQRQELEDAGFGADPVVFNSAGDRVLAGDDLRSVNVFNILASRRR